MDLARISLKPESSEVSPKNNNNNKRYGSPFRIRRQRQQAVPKSLSPSSSTATTKLCGYDTTATESSSSASSSSFRKMLPRMMVRKRMPDKTTTQYVEGETTSSLPSTTSCASTVVHGNKATSPRSSSSLLMSPPTPPLLEESSYWSASADAVETITTKEKRDKKKKKKSKKYETECTAPFETRKKKKKAKCKEKIVHDINQLIDKAEQEEKRQDDTSATSTAEPSFSPKAKRKKHKKSLSPEHEEFREKVSFAFALCRRQTPLVQQEAIDSHEESCFLPLIRLNLDEVNLHTLKRLAKKNADLRLRKLHLYQLTYGSHSHLEAFLDIFQRHFPTITQIVLSSSSLQIQDIHTLAKRFENLTELCLYGGGHALTEEIFSPMWDETWCRLASRVARSITLPHMGRCLPQGIFRGLAQSTCIVKCLNLKIDAKDDVERLVEALCEGRSVRKLRLESATCRVDWLDALLTQYDMFEELELYQCQNTHEQDDDRLAAWMI